MLWSPEFERVLAPYREIVFCDAEYYAPEGHHPIVICLVYYLCRAQQVGRLWLWGTSLRHTRHSRSISTPCLWPTMRRPN